MWIASTIAIAVNPPFIFLDVKATSHIVDRTILMSWLVLTDVP